MRVAKPFRESMSHPRPNHAGVEPPLVAAPPRFVDRRVAFRRATDQLAHRETALLARSLDILAADVDAETRLAGLLQLLATTVGARRAAVLADGHGRRVAVTADGPDDHAEAQALGAWLDAWAPRPRAARAAAGRAPIAIVTVPRGKPATPAGPDAPHHFACLPIPSAGEVVLGFDFATEAGPGALEERLPPSWPGTPPRASPSSRSRLPPSASSTASAIAKRSEPGSCRRSPTSCARR